MSAKEIVIDLLQRLPNTATLDEIAREVRRAAQPQTDFPLSAARLPVFRVPPGTAEIPPGRAAQLLADEPA